MKKEIGFCILLIFSELFPGCSSDALDTSADDSLVEIRLSGGIGSATSVSTRGAGMINGTDTWSDNLAVSFARADESAGESGNYSSGYLAAPLDGSITSAPTSGTVHTISFSPLAYYQANGKKSKLIGWYPAATFTQDTHIVTFSTDILDGSTDLMATVLYEGSKSSVITSPVTFNHLLTQISVRVYTESSSTATVWGDLISVAIKSMKQSCTLTLPAADAAAGSVVTTAFGGETADLPLVAKNPSDNTSISYPLTPGEGNVNAVVAGYAMFAPLINSDNTLNKITLELVTSVSGTHTATISAPNGGFQAGNSYLVTLKFGVTGIAPSVSITDWETGTVPDEVEI